MFKKIFQGFKLSVLLFISVLLAVGSVPIINAQERAQVYTGGIQFNYISWTVDALFTKSSQTALSPQRYLDTQEQEKIIRDYFSLVAEIQNLQGQISDIYSNPIISNPAQQSKPLFDQLNQEEELNKYLAPLSESILQQQISSTLAEMGISFEGQTIPPLLYRSTPLPMALIISPLDRIEEIADISLIPNLELDQIVQLESTVEENLDVSALVVNIGGVGIYPTMVESTPDIPWTIETIAHEWTHNYLTLHPLGMLYLESPSLRTMNETTADIVGKEVSQVVLEKYYPDLVPSPTPTPQPTKPGEEPQFDFNAEMHKTRVEVDKLLSEGKIKKAESYMDARRVFFYDHGYRIRKINQAYFAFYGAYAAGPPGAQGNDPVGPAVVDLRDSSSSLAAFLNRIAWMTSFEELQKAVNQ
jgi:hypothetical protein